MLLLCLWMPLILMITQTVVKYVGRLQVRRLDHKFSPYIPALSQLQQFICVTSCQLVNVVDSWCEVALVGCCHVVVGRERRLGVLTGSSVRGTSVIEHGECVCQIQEFIHVTSCQLANVVDIVVESLFINIHELAGPTLTRELLAYHFR